MKPVKQEDLSGCGVACVAALLGKSYQEALQLFPDGKKKAGIRGFFCKEIIGILKKEKMSYALGYAKGDQLQKLTETGTIVFLKRSEKYPGGHYLIRWKDRWMDSWINFPKMQVKAGFRKRLSGKPQFILYPLALV